MADPLLYAVTVLIWGSTWFAIRFQLGPVPPDLSVAYRFGLAGALLAVFCLLTGRSLRFSLGAHAAIALQGLFLFCANYILIYLATPHLTTGLIAVIFSTILPMNVLNGAVLLGTPVDRRVLAGGAVGVLGMPLLFWSQIAGFKVSSGGLIGLGLSFAGTLSASLGSVISARNQSAGLPVVQTNALGMSYGALLTLAFVLARGAPVAFDGSFPYLASLIYLAVFGSVVAFGCYLTLLGHIGADRAAYAMVLFPVIALVVSTIFEGYRWTLFGTFGVALILAGNLIVLLRRQTRLPSGETACRGSVVLARAGDAVERGEIPAGRMESPRSPGTPRFSTQDITVALLALGTALVVYWQPLSKTILLKPSDAVFVGAICVWMLSFNRERWGRMLRSEDAWFIPPLLASILVATLLGYVQYHLGMSRTGTLLLARLLVCVLLFLAVYTLLRRDTALRRPLSLAFLSPLVLFPAMVIPPVSALMWDSDGRFQGLTLNANTAATTFLIAFAVAYTLGAYEAGLKRRLRAAAFLAIAAGMLTLILWTQSRAYLIAAFGSALLGTVLVARHQRVPNLKFALAASAGLALVVAGVLLLAPGRFTVAYLTRVSPAYYRTADDPGATQRTAPGPAGPQGAMSKIQRFSAGIMPRLEDDIRTPAIRYYSKLLSTNYLGLGLNYESKFTVYHAPTRTYHGTNTILDLPVYGGIGAVLSVAYLALLVGRRTRRTLSMAVDENVPYTIAAVTALGGLWGAAILVGSPLFDYQFWILTAIVLA